MGPRRLPGDVPPAEAVVQEPAGRERSQQRKDGLMPTLLMGAERGVAVEVGGDIGESCAAEVGCHALPGRSPVATDTRNTSCRTGNGYFVSRLAVLLC